MEEIVEFIAFCLMVFLMLCPVIGLIRNSSARRRLIKTMENSCARCVHLSFDKNDKPRCDLHWGGYCHPSNRRYYHPSDF